MQKVRLMKTIWHFVQIDVNQCIFLKTYYYAKKLITSVV